MSRNARHHDAPTRPRLRLLFGHAIAIGPGKAQLLEHIAEGGSISAAARQMGMSYRRAWLLVDTMNHCFRSPLVETAAGGKGGGGAVVTPLGLQVLEHYRRMQQLAEAAVADELAALERLIAPAPPLEPH
ncbi:MAG: LysR family transcriptional regulator [Gammaproteobacteria bacterium]|nr:LysR family transcriptional regulator [Gammaproteobacteria bacterium]MCW8839491.1 LysR family transcriptional regulator [Gammaproteobacteria bacterium]MCW8957903.1 LysR family transcriptional regulator [Gammaproteobacteria bacterium]MCW8972305.1 LysR family transcriptional regulator [Gammaproteobacteria bacterium]MCW8992725.1 LysR family transcriptional regulator [Gammaproteobacteria bacterium]